MTTKELYVLVYPSTYNAVVDESQPMTKYGRIFETYSYSPKVALNSMKFRLRSLELKNQSIWNIKNGIDIVRVLTWDDFILTNKPIPEMKQHHAPEERNVEHQLFFNVCVNRMTPP